MIILYLLGLMGLIGGIFTVIWICTHDYSKDMKDDIDDYLIK